ncbi:MAG: winged helix-turn-helix domain-containing protein [Acidobacteriota bacterium]|nr:winged helix-turn-helix domain-containing protein [Acidobacteriota bacterium]
MNASNKALREFGEFRLDTEKKVLWHEEQPVQLPLKAVELLSVLIENCGEVVTKDVLLREVWGETFVEESALSHNVYLLRKTLQTLGGEKDLIQTVPRRGYRFQAEVREAETENVIIERETREQFLFEETERFDSPEELPSRIENGKSSARFLSFFPFLSLPKALTAMFVLSAAAIGTWQFLPSKRASIAASEAVAIPAQFDFVKDGKTTTDFGSKSAKAQAIALQSDGKIVVGGWAGENQGTSDFAVARYKLDGSLDESFDGDGKVITALSPYTDYVYDVTIQPDGKILAAGFCSSAPAVYNLCVVRYRSDGALDPSFDANGIVMLAIGENSSANSIVVQPDGKIVVAGSARFVTTVKDQQLSHNDFVLARFNADGSLDANFGTGGKAISNFGYWWNISYALALQPDGKIIAAGSGTNGANNDFVMARYNSNGSLDIEFGTKGKVRTAFLTEDEHVWDLKLQPDGKIIAAGNVRKDTLYDFALARYKPDGSLDESFGEGGKVIIGFGNNSSDTAREVELQPDGKILIAGSTGIGAPSPEFAFARMLADGKLDESFNQTGKMRVPFPSGGEAFGMILLPSEGFAVAAGSAGDGKSSKFGLARVKL